MTKHIKLGGIMLRTIRYALLGSLLFTGCGVREEPQSDSTLNALKTGAGVGALSFYIQGGKVWLKDGQGAYTWGHAAPTVSGNNIQFGGRIIGQLNTGYFCNGPFDSICDATISKVNYATITLKAAPKAPAAGSQMVYLNANTRDLIRPQFGPSIQGVRKGICTVATNNGLRTLTLTAEARTVTLNGQNVIVYEIKTPIWVYNASAGAPQPSNQMRLLQRVYSTNATEVFAPSTSGVQNSSTFLALFQ